KNKKEQDKEIDRRVAEIEGKAPPFFPLFYRCNDGNQKGTILYPPTGWGRFYRDEVLAAIKWCETFSDHVVYFEYMGAREFKPKLKNPNDPMSYEKPLAFVQNLFDRRAQVVTETKAKVKTWEAGGMVGPKPYNILEKAIKLILNSLYGKMAQSI